MRTAASREEAHAVVTTWAQALLTGPSALQTYELCVCGEDSGLREAFAAAHLPTLELRPNDADPQETEAGIRLAVMPRIKGLEFRAVAVVLTGDQTRLLKEESLAGQRLRCLLYVAMTRAREHLLVCSGP